MVFAPGRRRHVPRRAPQVAVDAGPLGDVLEGASRPGHFDGVLTVVAKLLHIVAPGRRVLRREGLPAAALIRRMVARPRTSRSRSSACPTVREPDGLALSSRNALPRRAGARAGARPVRGRCGPGRRAGAGRRTRCWPPARAVLAAEPAIAVDYLELRDPDLGPDAAGRPRPGCCVAARVGTTRLIDNVAVTLVGS